MIDPIKMTRYNQSKEELEETLLFCCCTAGKTAITTAKILDGFLYAVYYRIPLLNKPFEAIRDCLNLKLDLVDTLRKFGFGCYNHRARTFKELVESNLDLKTCTAEDLEKIYGIGCKTSRFFLLHTRENVKVAVIDTHIQKRLRLVWQGMPKTLTKKNYKLHEEAFFEDWDNYNLKHEKKLTLAEYDLKLWNWYRENKNGY